jgi:outer membrane protein OmpA-like peptidoglycan-associated protein
MIQGVAVCARRAWFAESLGVAAGCAAALAGWSAPAHAQDKGPTLELGLYGGAFLPDEQNHEFYDPARSQHQPIDPVAPELGLRVAFFPLGFIGVEGEADVLPQSIDSGATVTLYGARGHLIVRLPAPITPARITPFLLGGLGTMGVRSGTTELATDADTIGHAGIGATIRLGSRFSLRADGRAMRAPRADSDDGTYHFAALLGATFTIGDAAGGRPVVLDVDMDGIADANDSCPHESGLPPDGCPAVVDSDSDGLADDSDRCPAEAETINGHDDEDGCPDELPDRDGDRIVDRSDTCPDEPEDVDGFEDEDGCPDRDNDGDQVVDLEDRCPIQAGPTANQGCPDVDRDQDGVVDRLDNCPDEAGRAAQQGCQAQQYVVITPEQLRVLDPITFTTARTKIRRRSLRVLDNLAAVLAQHPELPRIRIAGHTDDRGGAELNKQLSQQRADAVMQYLIGRGVPAARLETIGHGEDRPIEANSRAAGRAMNRRVDFEIVRPVASVD